MKLNNTITTFLFSACVLQSHAVVTTVNSGAFGHTGATITSSGTTHTAFKSYDYSNAWDFDGDGTNDSFTFDLTSTYTDGTLSSGLTVDANGLFRNGSGGNFSDGSFVFTLDNFAVTLSGGGTANSISFLGIDGLTFGGYNSTGSDQATIDGVVYDYTTGNPSFDLTTDAVTLEISGSYRVGNILFQAEVDADQVPEPTSAMLLGFGLLAGMTRRRR